MPKPRSWVSLLAFGATVGGAGWLAARFSPTDVRTRIWYRRLRKPRYDPPQPAFPIVWTALYALIAVSGWGAFATVINADIALRNPRAHRLLPRPL